jgi:two-component system alkaline phosphatase synthesis response regulator PhoP
MPTGYLTPKVLVASNCLTTGPLWAPVFETRSIEIIRESNLTNIVNCWEENIPDLVIFDITPLDDHVLQQIKDLREEAAVPMLLLTSSGDPDLILRAYDVGVDDCILKPIAPKIFQAKLRAWLRRSWIVPADTLDPLRLGKLQLIPSRRVVIVNGDAPVRLTNLEMRLLYTLMSKPERAIRNEELIQKVWGFNEQADIAALKNIVYRLRKKLEADPSSPRMILNVPGVGYLFSAGNGNGNGMA